MNRPKLFAALRARGSGVFGTSLSTGQVQGVEALLDSCDRNRVANPHHVANILAQVYHETGRRMLPVRETFAGSDDEAISRLERAWKAGKLPWVKTPYWRDGGFGRGQIQLTNWPMYEKMGERLGLPLRAKPSLALDLKIGADVAVIGMSEGLFTGKKLSDYTFPAALNALPKNNPRRIVNGQDGTDEDVAGYHRAFYAALNAAGYSAADEPAPAPEPTPTPAPEVPAAPAPPPAAPTPEPAKPKTEPPKPTTAEKPKSKGIFGLIGALILVGLYSFWAWLSALPCDLVGLWC